MKSIQVFDPALCCSTGVCGVDVDQALVTFSADVAWAQQGGAKIARFNLAQQPLAFADNAVVKGFLERSGAEGLPLVLVDGDVALAGRCPNRVELQRRSRADFVRILRDTEGSLIRQCQALLEVDGCRLTVTEDAMDELAGLAAELNKRMENIGARRLQTILAQLLDDVLYDVPESHRGDLAIDGAFVRERLGAIVRDEDLARYIL